MKAGSIKRWAARFKANDIGSATKLRRSNWPSCRYQTYSRQRIARRLTQLDTATQHRVPHCASWVESVDPQRAGGNLARVRVAPTPCTILMQTGGASTLRYRDFT